MKNTNLGKTISFKNLYAFGEKLPVDLSLTENPLGFSPKVKKALLVGGVNFNDYPDPKLLKLKKAIADKFNVNIPNIFISNGSEGILKILPSALMEKNDEAIIPEITFLMFEVVVSLNDSEIIISKMTDDFDIDLDDIKRKITNKTRLVFICNPNNPTGKIIPKRKLISFIKSIKPLAVVDEANIEFGGESVIGETSKIKNLIVLRTFSKGFGLAGLRIGFAVAGPKIIKRLEEVNQPFPINVLAEEAAISALSDDQFIRKTKKFMDQERRFLTVNLQKRGFKVVGSKANNLLINVSRFNRNNDFIDRLNKLGVSVVRGSSFRGLNDNFMRVSPRLRKTNKLFIGKIDQLIAEKS